MKILSVLFVLSLLLFSCKSDLITMTYEQTSCNDEWGYNHDSDSDQVNLVEEYLEDKGVKVKKISLTDDGVGQSCLACSCTTGRIFVVEVDSKYKDELSDLGFTQ